MTDFKGRRVVVVGLARSGVSAANALLRLGALVTVNDRRGPEELKRFVAGLDAGVSVELGGHPGRLLENADLIVASPGVPLDIGPLKRASEKGVRIIGELELSYIIGKGTEFLAITGTNGKSTTTMLVYEMLRNSGLKAVVGGNIGTALTDLLFQPAKGSGQTEGGPAGRPDFIVAEVSSFQLESIAAFRPRAATILNITPDHLDRHHSMSGYMDAKCRVFLNQTKDDCLVLNADDPLTGEIRERLGRQSAGGTEIPRVLYFSRAGEVEGAYLKDGLIHFNTPFIPPDFCLNTAAFRIKGVHNVENAMSAALISLSAGGSPEAVAKTLAEFPGLEHRLEPVREKDGVRYINDSKGTNVGAVIKSLEGFSGPVILIAGGRDKDGNFSLLAPLVKEKVKALILIGEAADKLGKALGNSAEVFREDGLEGAVLRARALASPGDVVLLSPACASFDMFRDFEDRGRRFKKAVMEL